MENGIPLYVSATRIAADLCLSAHTSNSSGNNNAQSIAVSLRRRLVHSLSDGPRRLGWIESQMQAKRVTEQLQIILYSERVSLISVEALADWVGSLASTRALRLGGMERGDEKLGRRSKRKQHVVNMVRDKVRRAKVCI